MKCDDGKASHGADEPGDESRACGHVDHASPSRAYRAENGHFAHGPAPLSRIRRALGFAGVAMALPFFVWLPLGLLGVVPSMVDVFGEAGLRTPASITVGGLLIAALGFHEL